ncbi:unnamed protein product [Brassica rapa subsp. trilocularis]
MMVIVGENMVRKIFMVPRTLEDTIDVHINSQEVAWQ